RAAGQDEVYLTSDLSASDLGVQPTDWTDRIYLSVPQDQVMRLSLENQNGEFTFVRPESGGELGSAPQ
ncbi:MAG: hypothetical protein GWN58_02160, partial [Anaerolineae bacterium]|nr:hypothetical protein [Anaerolineae bacterium]